MYLVWSLFSLAIETLLATEASLFTFWLRNRGGEAEGSWMRSLFLLGLLPSLFDLTFETLFMELMLMLPELD